MTKKKIKIEPLEALEDVKNEETIESTSEEPPIKIETSEKSVIKPKKTDKTITCQHCNKVMLEKTYKYYHSLKCNPVSATAPPVAYKDETPHTVKFDFTRRLETKKAKYSNLISQAF